MFHLLAISPAFVLDLAVIIVLVVFGFIGFSRGLVRSLISLLGTFVCFLIALFLSKYVVNALEQSFGVLSFFSDLYYDGFFKISVLNIDISAEGAAEALQQANIPAFLAASVLSGFAQGAAPGTTLAVALSQSFASFTVSVISVILIFLLLRVLVAILEHISKATVERIPIVSGVNRIFGFLFGVVQGAFFLYAVLLVLSLFHFEDVVTFVNESGLFAWMYNQNLLAAAIDAIISYDWTVTPQAAAGLAVTVDCL